MQPGISDKECAVDSGLACSLPDKPSIAVLPFTNKSSDGEQEYFADGMTENLITDLSKLSGLLVISRNSVFTCAASATIDAVATSSVTLLRS